MDPRRAALAVLIRLESEPTRLEKLLEQELGRVKSPADRRLAANLVYEILRHRALLDHRLSKVVSRPMNMLDPPVLAVLRLGAAELCLTRTPDHAAVHQAVELAKKGGARRASGMVNGALRSLARTWRDIPLPGAPGSARRLAVEHSHPVWVVQELMEQMPPEEAAAWLAAGQTERPAAVRANTLKNTPGELAELLAPKAGQATPHPLAAESLLLPDAPRPLRDLPGFGRGLWQIQDPGATALSRLVGAAPGMRVLDLCAGAGGKTGHLAALMQNQGVLGAVEPSPGRFRGLTTNLKRLGVTCAQPMQADARELAAPEQAWDAVLIDAPCSGLGTSGRRPDMRWRRTPADCARLAALQKELLAAAHCLVRPGGAIVYATCTMTRAENQEVALWAEAELPGLERGWDREAAGPAASAIDQDGFFRTLPHRHGCDAFFAARWVKAV